MTRRVLVRDAVALFAIALAARFAAALLVDAPPYVDAAYTTLVGERLATGNGFTVSALWSFLEVGGTLPPNPMLPVPSNGHWMPLSSIVAAAGMWLAGAGWRGGQLLIVPLAAALVPLTYLVGAWLWDSRRIARLGAVLAIFAGPMLVMTPLVESFAVFGVAGAGALMAATRAVEGSRPGGWLVLSGALCGLATLARVDGALLVVAPATAWVIRRDWSGRQLAWGVASATACLAVMAPWVARNLTVFGSAFPSAGGHTLWITSYNEQFSISAEPSLGTYLAWGIGPILASKALSVAELLGRTTVLLGGIFVVGFVVALWGGRQRRVLLPFITYFTVMFGAMALIFTFHAPKGAFYHSAWAWLPFAFPMSVAGMRPAAELAGRAWPLLRRSRAQSLLVNAGLVGAVILSLVGSATLLVQWRAERQPLEAAAAFLRREAGSDPVLAYDAASLSLLTDAPVVAPPFDPFPVVESVIDAYDVRWVVVTLRPGEVTDPLNLWNGPASTDIDGNHATFLEERPAFETLRVRVYAVRA